MGDCKWCGGKGYQIVESGSSLSYRCPDCYGTGYIPECDICGDEYYEDYCEECYAECEECGEVTQKEFMENGLCEDCAYAANE